MRCERKRKHDTYRERSKRVQLRCGYRQGPIPPWVFEQRMRYHSISQFFDINSFCKEWLPWEIRQNKRLTSSFWLFDPIYYTYMSRLFISLSIRFPRKKKNIPSMTTRMQRNQWRQIRRWTPECIFIFSVLWGSALLNGMNVYVDSTSFMGLSIMMKRGKGLINDCNYN